MGISSHSYMPMHGMLNIYIYIYANNIKVKGIKMLLNMVASVF